MVKAPVGTLQPNDRARFALRHEDALPGHRKRGQAHSLRPVTGRSKSLTGRGPPARGPPAKKGRFARPARRGGCAGCPAIAGAPLPLPRHWCPRSGGWWGRTPNRSCRGQRTRKRRRDGAVSAAEDRVEHLRVVGAERRAGEDANRQGGQTGQGSAVSLIVRVFMVGDGDEFALGPRGWMKRDSTTAVWRSIFKRLSFDCGFMFPLNFGWPGWDQSPLSGEWRLLKAELAETRLGSADVALGAIAEFVARGTQARVFVLLPFDGTGFAPARPLRDQVPGQGLQQQVPENAMPSSESGSGHGMSKVAHRVQAALEAEVFEPQPRAGRLPEPSGSAPGCARSNACRVPRWRVWGVRPRRICICRVV